MHFPCLDSCPQKKKKVVLSAWHSPFPLAPGFLFLYLCRFSRWFSRPGFSAFPQLFPSFSLQLQLETQLERAKKRRRSAKERKRGALIA